MLYLVTGANGTGKTLNTLRWVRDLQLENPERPVFYNGRFDLKPEKEKEFGWAKFDFKDWQKLPDGSICLVDEAHNDLPVRPASQKPPDYVAALAEHRSRGFDFFFISQHPSNIDGFVRRLVGAPGWHRHLKRPFGFDGASCVEFDAVNLSCEKPNQAKLGQASRIKFPKEVYGWYNSAVMHTGKKTIPKQVWIFLASAVLVPLLIGYVFLYFSAKAESVSTRSGSDVQAAGDSASEMQQPAATQRAARMTKQEWMEEQVPRIEEFPHTAPKYDDLTKPVRVPMPAACMEMQSIGCRCYTQQGTLLPQIGLDTCRAIVKYGYFEDFNADNGQIGRGDGDGGYSRKSINQDGGSVRGG